jgi:hypothetical protein
MPGHEPEVALAEMTRRGFLARAGAGGGGAGRRVVCSAAGPQRDGRDEPDDLRTEVPQAASIRGRQDKVRADLMDWAGPVAFWTQATTSRPVRCY